MLQVLYLILLLHFFFLFSFLKLRLYFNLWNTLGIVVVSKKLCKSIDIFLSFLFLLLLFKLFIIWKCKSFVKMTCKLIKWILAVWSIINIVVIQIQKLVYIILILLLLILHLLWILIRLLWLYAIRLERSVEKSWWFSMRLYCGRILLPHSYPLTSSSE